MITVKFRANPLQHHYFRIDPNTYIIATTSTPRQQSHPHSWRPPTDVYETEDRVVVRVEIAGIADSDFQIQLTQNMLYINGIRRDKPERRAYHQMEIPFGEFATEVYMNVAVDMEKAEAEYTDGFLMVYLPKVEPKHIRITNKD